MTDIRAAAPDVPEQLSTSDVHDVLRNARRRHVLRRLRETGETETVSDLAEHIGSIEAGESPPPRNVRQSVYVSLHQTHLPKLDGLGIVAYDPDGKRVELGPNADDLDPHLDVAAADDRVPPTYYLGLGLFGAGVLLATLAGVPGLRAVGPGPIGVGLSTLLVGVALYDRRRRGGAGSGAAAEAEPEPEPEPESN